MAGDGSAALGLLSFAADRHPAGQLHTRATRELVQFPWRIRQNKKGRLRRPFLFVLVETAGIEPASVGTLPTDLHA